MQVYSVASKEFYTDLEDAYNELMIRRKSIELRTKIQKEIRITPELEFLFEEPHCIFFRQIATPLHETLRAIELSEEVGLKLFILEYYEDKFVSSGNTFKRGLGKLPIHKFTAPNHQDVFEYKTIVNFNANTGKKLSEIETYTNESLINIHHTLFKEIVGTNPNIIINDGSKWFSEHGSNASKYYESFFKLFITEAILLEVFLTEGDESKLTNQITLPCFKKVQDQYKLKPLIYNYLPLGEETRMYWDCYPSETHDLLVKKGYIE